MGASAERMKIKLARRGSTSACPAPADQTAHQVAGRTAAVDAEDVRLSLLMRGFRPIPAKGKRPTLLEWQESHALAAEIRGWNKGRHADALNTGIVLGDDLRAIDIDILDENLAEKIEGLVRIVTSANAPVRIGQYPKRCLVFRTDVGRQKVKLQLGSGHVEFLGDGQQVIVHGTHPQTLAPYRWEGAPLWEQDLASLPVLDARTEACLLSALQALARLHGPAVVTQDEDVRSPDNQQGVFSQASEQGAGPHALENGMRNNTLFAQLKREAPACESVDDLAAIGLSLNQAFSERLPANEVRKVANSVWRYKASGRLMLAGDAWVLIPKDEALLRNPDVLALYARLSLSHGAEPGKWIGVVPKSMERLMGMNEHRIRRARNALGELGYLKLVKKGGRGPNQPHRYIFKPKKIGS